MSLTQSRLKELLSYDPDTGVFRRRVRTSPRIMLGDIAGCTGRYTKSIQYRKICVDTKLYFAHRLAFLYMTGSWPVDGVDHIDRDGLNNRWLNLRPASQVTNMQNASLRKDNTSGVVGVCWSKRRNEWLARIVVNRQVIFLGWYDTLAEAADARKAAERKYGFHSNHGMVRTA